MKQIDTFKMPFSTKYFKANQKVWVLQLSGGGSARVAGKYQGKGRYIRVWVLISNPAPVIKSIEISDEFHKKLKRY